MGLSGHLLRPVTGLKRWPLKPIKGCSVGIGLLSFSSIGRPVYIESRVCVVKGVVKCGFEYLCVVYHTCRQHNVGVGEGTIKKIAEEHFGSATPGAKKQTNCILNFLCHITQACLKIWARQK